MNIITNEKNELIKIFPNPVNNILIINCEDIRETTMQIINMIGECVLQQKLNSEVNEINVSLLAKGMYIIKLNGKNYTEQKKLTKE
ncbi:MAG TPA: T9SS type A sorting domain-containing protein [Bacteroidales bacterium]|nr:T9SS type A sorting domain-containing protein [Bacteroidales bacterium]HPS18453.1 T9SS type A sorting domain-containing protein [Bacteroidales bacterium]